MLGTNMQLSVKSQLSSDVNTVIITPDVVKQTSIGGATIATTTIDTTELQDITSAAGQNTVIPIHRTSSPFYIGSTEGRGSIYGLNPTDIPKFLSVDQGQYTEGGSDALVGPTIASNFNMNLGTRIKIGSQAPGVILPAVRVSGILVARGITADNVNSDNAIIVPDLWYTNTYGGLNLYDQVNVVVSDISKLNETEAAINAKINRNGNVVRITDATSRLATINQTLGTMTSFILAIGAISLVVAAVSIFNVMMMSVKERVQEIGILLSIGTEKGEVRRMFLYEAFILGLIGAVVGGIMSTIIGYSVVSAMIGNTSYFFQPASIMFVPEGMIIGIVVCIASGLYPAWMASNMDPIDALRSE
jgi:putative ABC transport system permease protein